MIRFKYFLKPALELLLAASVIFLAVYDLVYEETQLHVKAEAVYSRLSGEPAEPLLLDLNTASERALQKISGIGEVTARAIVEYRELHGEFGSVDELDNVRGIGQATLEKIRPYLKV